MLHLRVRRARSRSSAFRSSISRRSRTGCPRTRPLWRVRFRVSRSRADVREQIERVREGRDGPVVVIVGPRQPRRLRRRPRSRRSPSSRALSDVRFLSALRRGNVHGALDAGLAPGFLPGRVTLDDGREWFTKRWGGAPEERGLDAAGHPAGRGRRQDQGAGAARRRSVRRLPRRVARASRARGRADDRSRSTRSSPTRPGAPTCSCPARSGARRPGSVTNLEGRVQRVGRKVAPEGTAMDDWRIAVELAFRLGDDLDLATVDEVTDELAADAPAFAGVTAELLQRARDGVVLPLQRTRRRDRVAHARAHDHGRRRLRHVVGPDQGRG